MEITDSDRLDFIGEYLINLYADEHRFIMVYQDKEFNIKITDQFTNHRDLIDAAIRAMEGKE